MVIENEKPNVRMRYENACHAMQSGVAVEMGFNPRPTDPKHLRVGVNSAMVDCAAMAKLLIAKGVITEDEYLEAVAAEMELEAKRYRERLSEHYGAKIDLA